MLRTYHPMRKQSDKGRARSDAWAKTVRLVAKRDGYKCRAKIKGVCVRDYHDVHHLVMKSANGSDEPENLIAVCRPCHDWIGLNKEQASELGLVVSPKHDARRAVERNRS